MGVLRKLRTGAAIAVIAVLTFYFVDFAGILPQWAGWLTRLQLMPAFFVHSAVIIGALIVFTLLFGRLYCSVLCPLGIFQDISAWLSKRFSGKKKKRYKYSKPRTILRWVMLGVLVAAVIAGFAMVQSLLDPYAAYGRISSNLFYPLYVLGNNLLELIFKQFGNYTFYRMDPAILNAASFTVALATFGVVGFMAWKWGRLYCNTVCPVGTFLGIFGRFSLLGIRIDKSKCTSCGVCESRCKATCISAKGKSVDNSRCVACYDCVDTCKFGALRYGLPKQAAGKEEQKPRKASVMQAYAGVVPDDSRRRFLAASLAAVAFAPKVLAQQKIWVLEDGVSYKREYPITPPGALGQEHLNVHCTACHLCISKCPSRVLKPAFNEYGLSGFMQPVMFFEKGFCNFDCTVCGDVCPNGAITPLTVEEKHLTQVGRVVFIEANCIVVTDNTNCGACSEHCPTQAVKMVPYRDGLTIPQTDPDICVGCGGCEFICPVRPFRAIYVNGNPEHKQRAEFHDEAEEVIIDDFGF